LSGHAKTQVTLRDRLSSAFVLGWQSSRLPTDYVRMAKVSCRARGHVPVRGMTGRVGALRRWMFMQAGRPILGRSGDRSIADSGRPTSGGANTRLRAVKGDLGTMDRDRHYLHDAASFRQQMVSLGRVVGMSR
jgi:hypothetical protein